VFLVLAVPCPTGLTCRGAQRNCLLYKNSDGKYCIVANQLKQVSIGILIFTLVEWASFDINFHAVT